MEESSESSGGDVRVKQVTLPEITIQEFTAPNFVKAEPPHKAIVPLAELTKVQLSFSRQISGKPNIVVLTGNKLVATGGTIAPADPAMLILPISAGAFQARDFSDGVYEVYYDVCFAGDTCYKGQYAFIGIQ